MTQSSYPTVKEELFKARDELLSSLKTYLTMLSIIEDTETFHEFISYIDRFTASEVTKQLKKLIGQEGIDKILDDYQSSPTTARDGK
jgi:hypothetical protein